MRRPFMPFYTGDYHADTQHLETAQHGAYLLLIMHYWANEGLPDDEHELARITKLPLRSWRQMCPKIQAFFHDGWHHKRIDDEIGKYDRKIAKLKVSGSIGGTKTKIARDKAKQMLLENGSQASSKATAKNADSSCSQAAVSLPIKNISSFFPTTARAREAEQSGLAMSEELVGLVASKGRKQ